MSHESNGEPIPAESARFDEFYLNRTGLTVGVRKVLFSRQSPYQKVDVLRTDSWGNLMTIDGLVMLSEKDEFVYHEMLVHVPMLTHPGPRRVMIIGGGDGGSAREVLKHPGVEHVDMVEIDQVVVEASKLHFPGVGRFDDPRLHVRFEDGIEFVRRAAENGETYDVVIIDGSDPVGPAEGLFEASFVRDCRNVLSGNGVFCSQSESPWVKAFHPGMKRLHSALNRQFPRVDAYLCWIPLYPAGMWSMMLATLGDAPTGAATLERVRAAAGSFLSDCRYYNADIHSGAFALPTFVQEILSQE